MNDNAPPAPTSSDDTLLIAGWNVHISRNLIVNGSQSVRLEPRAMAVLICLTESPGEVVTRRQIEDTVWPGMVIGYDALSNTVAKLRKAFGDDRKNPRIIETIPKVGYRLMTEVDSALPVATQEKQLQRKLAAILYADVAEYSRLTEADEEGTHQTLSEYLDAIAEAIAHHNGKVVHYAGDAVLAEFATVVEALMCAVAVQQDLATRNTGRSADRRVQFRIGINLGDVIVDRDDIYGEGVNVAARLESLAPPGGICLSEAVRGAVGNRLSFDYEFLGEQSVRNIEHPIRVYRLVLDNGEAAVSPRHAARTLFARRFPKRLAAGGAVLLLVLGAAAWWIDPWNMTGGQDSAELPALALPSVPSIVVLPFVNMSDDVTQEYFVDGMTEDLITDLARISELFVISRNSAFTYKGRSVDVQEVGKRLGVRYVLEGSVRRAGDQVRVNAQLIDATTGGHVWAERLDESVSHVFELQDRVTRIIVNALALRLLPQEARRIARFETTNSAAHDAYLLGLSAYYRRTPEDNARARDQFELAIELDPDYGAAQTALAKVYVQTVVSEQAYADALGIYWLEGYVRAWKLLDQSELERSADYHVLRSWLHLRKHQHELAINEAELALQLKPNDADAMEALSEALIFAGQPESGLKYAAKAIRQNPALPARPLYLKGLAQFALDNNDEAIESVERALREAPQRKANFAALLAAVYGRADRLDAARSAFATYRQGLLKRPSMSAASEYAGAFANPRIHSVRWVDLAWSVYAFPFSDRDATERFASGLRAAGAPASVGGYLPLYRENRLSGSEARLLLFERTIEGKDFWLSRFPWRQVRAGDGAVQHSGHPIHPGLPNPATGHGKIRDDLLCERWPAVRIAADICVAIYRITDRNARVRWGEYVMVTDTGPHPFSVAERPQ